MLTNFCKQIFLLCAKDQLMLQNRSCSLYRLCARRHISHETPNKNGSFHAETQKNNAVSELSLEGNLKTKSLLSEQKLMNVIEAPRQSPSLTDFLVQNQKVEGPTESCSEKIDLIDSSPSVKREVLEVIRPSQQLRASLATDDEREKLQMIESEYEMMLFSGEKVPRTMNDERWRQLMGFTAYRRAKIYRYWCKTESSIRSKAEKKVKRAKELADRRQEREQSGEMPNLDRLYIMIEKRWMSRNSNWRLLSAINFGQSIVFDMDYEKYMVNEDLNSLVHQIESVIGATKTAAEPFHVHFCNCPISSKFYQKMEAIYRPHSYSGSFGNEMFTVTEQSYLDLFPKQRLVYLTPHCRGSHQVLHHFDPNDVYIIGGFVDFHVQKPISLARAREQGLRVARLPIDYYVKWRMGTKNLTLDQVYNIMLGAKSGLDWETNLTRHLPSRKFIPLDVWKQSISENVVSDTTDPTELSNRLYSSDRQSNRRNRVTSSHSAPAHSAATSTSPLSNASSKRQPWWKALHQLHIGQPVGPPKQASSSSSAQGRTSLKHSSNSTSALSSAEKDIVQSSPSSKTRIIC